MSQIAPRSLLSFVLAALMAFEPALAHASSQNLPQHKPQFEGQTYEGLGYFEKATEDRAWGEYLTQQLNQAEPSNLEKIAAGGTDLVKLMAKYRDFFAESMRKVDALAERIGPEGLVKQLDENKIYFDDPDLGRMEFTNIDGAPLAKIVHKASGVSFLIYDENMLDRTSKHFQQYLSRQHYDAGMTRRVKKYVDQNGKTHKIRMGRDAVLMSIKDMGDADMSRPESRIELAPRKRGFRNWWQATYKAPTGKDVLLGISSGIAQFASIGALATGLAWLLPDYSAHGAPLMTAAFSLAYGSLFGIWCSFYHNWRNRGSRGQIFLKNMAVSMGYYFGVVLIGKYGVQLLTVNDFSVDPAQMVASIQQSLVALVDVKNSPAAALTLGHFVTNFFTNNEGKFQQVVMPRVFEVERTDLGDLTIPVPKGIARNPETGKLKLQLARIPTPIPKRFWNRQIKYYLPLNGAKFLDQAWFGMTLAPALSGAMPIWMPFLSVLGFGAYVAGSIRAITWWAYKYHKDAADKLNVADDSKYYYLPFWKELFNRQLENTQARLQGIKNYFTTVNGDLGSDKSITVNVNFETRQPTKSCDQLLSGDDENKAS